MHPIVALYHVNIFFHPVSASIEIGWNHFPTSEQFRWALQLTLGLTRQMLAQAWIVDLRQLRLVAAPDYTWLNTTWFPQFAALPVSLLAIVLPDHPIAAADAQRKVIQLLPVDGPVCIQYFTSLHEARHWAAQLP